MACWRNIASCPRANFDATADEPEDFDVAIALDTAMQNRLGTAVRAVRSRKTLDQHRSSSEQSRLRRSRLHRFERAGDRTDSFRADQDQQSADDMPRSPKIFSSRSRPIPARFNIRTPPRALLRSARNSFARGATWAGSASELYENYPRRRIELLRELLAHHALRGERSDRQFQSEL